MNYGKDFMSMNNKIRLTAIAAASALAFGSVTAYAVETEYYGDVKLPEINYADISGEAFDRTAFDRAAENARKIIDNGGRGLPEALDAFDAIVEDAVFAYNIAYIKSSKNNTEENNNKCAEIFNEISDMIQSYMEIIKRAYENGASRAAVTEWIGGEEEMRAFLEEYPDERFYELAEEESELKNEYHNCAFSEYVYTDKDGRQYTYASLEEEADRLLGDMSDGETQQRIAELMEAIYGYYEESGGRLAEIFMKMVRVRDETAKISGFDNYAQYAYETLYGRDYGIDEAAEFHAGVKKHIVPVYKRLGEMLVSSNAPTDMSDGEIIAAVGECIGDISSEMKTSYDYMISHGMLDMEYSENKVPAGNAYTVMLEKYEVPYIFISPNEENDIWKVDSLIHEFGHFNTMLYDPYYRIPRGGSAVEEDFLSQNTDLSEVDSQGLEMLFMEYNDELYGVNAPDADIYRIYSMLDSICSGCLFDEWQTIVYENPRLSAEEADAVFNSLAEDYGTYGGGLPYLWTGVTHNFDEPMYYISYAVSAMASLELWSAGLEDKDRAREMYMRLSSMGDHVPFRAALNDAGFGDIFSEDAMSRAAKNIEEHFTLGYEDVELDSWYANAVYCSADYINGAGKLFEPDKTASRIETVDSIGRYYEYTGGVADGGDEAFSDTDGDGYAAWAKGAGIVSGYGDGSFGAFDPLTREQAAVMLMNYTRFRGCETEYEAGAADAFFDSGDISRWANEAMDWAASNGIMNGTDTGCLLPGKTLSKAELAQLMTNYARQFGN